jgi:hypothetical protein
MFYEKVRKKAQVEWPGLSVRGEMTRVSLIAEPVEKVQKADYTNFDIVINQQVTGHRKSQNAQIWGFSTASLET